MYIEYFRSTILAVIALSCTLVFTFPPTNLLWKVKIVLSEFPHWIIIIALLLFALPFYQRGWHVNFQAICLAYLIMASAYPIISAYRLGKTLPQQLSSSLNIKVNNENAFSLTQLFTSQPLVVAEACSYKNGLGNELSLDFYRPSSQQKTPCLVVIHGGGWNAGDNKQLSDMNSYFAAQGIAVAAINYSLAPKFKSPQQVNDVLSAMAYLSKNAERFNIDSNNFSLLGRSAGGQIALQTAYSKKLPNIKSVIAIYAPADMIWGYELSTDNAVIRSKTLISDYVGGSLESNYEGYAAASALSHVDERCPPTLMIHGLKDNMVAYGHNLRLIEKLKPARVPHFLLTLPWATHGCDYNLNGPSGQLSRFAITHFVKKWGAEN